MVREGHNFLEAVYVASKKKKRMMPRHSFKGKLMRARNESTFQGHRRASFLFYFLGAVTAIFFPLFGGYIPRIEKGKRNVGSSLTVSWTQRMIRAYTVNLPMLRESFLSQLPYGVRMKVAQRRWPVPPQGKLEAAAESFMVLPSKNWCSSIRRKVVRVLLLHHSFER